MLLVGLVLLQERHPRVPGVLTPPDNTPRVGVVNPPDGVEEAVLAGEVPFVEPSACVHRVAAEIGKGVAAGAPQKRSGHALFNNTKRVAATNLQRRSWVGQREQQNG